MESPTLRALMLLVAGCLALLGAVLFVAPGWSSSSFPWRVSPFLAMTMGAWYLGVAVFALEAARVWHWATAYAAFVFVWAFSVGQGVLLVIHADILDLDEPLGIPYLTAVGVAAIVAVAGIVDVVRGRPARELGAAVPRTFRVLTATFVLALIVLTVPLLDGYDNPGSIWPGELTLISARAFAVFFLALAVSAAVLLRGGLGTFVAYLRPALVLNALVLLPVMVYVKRFDIGDHPGQLLYIGLYVIVFVLSLGLLAYARRHGTTAASIPESPQAREM